MLIGSINEMLPVVNFASRDVAKAGDYWGPRAIPDYQLFYVVSGEAVLDCGGETRRILPGRFAYYGHLHPHRLRVLERTEYFSIHFLWSGPSAAPVHPAYGIRDRLDESELWRAVPTYSIMCPGYGTVELPFLLAAPGAETLMMRIVKEYRLEAAGYPFLLRALMMELLMLLLRQRMEGEAGKKPGKIDAALHAMREQPARPWTVSELAALCGYHPSYFTQLFYQEQGQKPKQFLIDERIKQAKQALLRGEPVEKVAERLGYGSIHYFSNHFKKETGLSPSEFRQQPGRKADETPV